MGRRRSRQFWRGTVTEYEESGRAAAAFAEEGGLNANTLKWWAGRRRSERRGRAAEEAPGFVEVAPASLPVVADELRGRAGVGRVVTLCVGGGVMLALDEVPSAEYVAAVARCYDGVFS